MDTAQQTRTMGVADLDAFVADNYRRLVGLLVLRAGDRHAAEELAQESLIKLVKHGEQVRVMDNPWAWLATVAINQSRSRWRRLLVAERAVNRLPISTESGPDQEGLTELLLVVAELPERQRTALLLRHHAHLSVKETAAAMGCAEGTVKSLTSRAVIRLRRDLNEELDDAND